MMEEYRQRLEALTGETDVWEEYTPPANEATRTATVSHSKNTKKHTPDKADSSASPPPANRPSNLLTEMLPQNEGSTAESSSEEEHGLEKTAWPVYGLKKGGKSSRDEVFSPWKLVKLYPYAFVGKRNGERAAPFFKEPRIYQDRIWDFFYIYHPLESDDKPIFFVPTYQFERLLEEVNEELEAALTIPRGVESEKYRLCFGLGETTRPRFLGRSTGPEIFEKLEASVPPPNPADTLDGISFRAKDDFLEQLNMVQKFKPKKSDKSVKNRMKWIQNHRAWGKSLKRVQRYLGLRSKVTMAAGAGSGLAPELSLDAPVQAEPEGMVRFVCVDIEAYEFNQNIITEVGIATLDTRHIVGVPPGEGGKNWLLCIQAHHIRIKENAWARNVKHIRGCAANFNFG